METMPQKPNLAAALADAGGSTRRRAISPVRGAIPVKRTQAAGEPPEGASQPGRTGTKPITAHLPGQVRSQLKILAAEQGSTLQDLMSEAFNDLFAKYGKPEIAPQKAVFAAG
jgi:hypothetical protein